ncbi:hypothetical protein LCGC14_2120960 [marine sediment metagenome]|uniref:CBM-cenC domain-containing protein n=1 Tax=marine sediment metagenome TaxID=412755 RepID=A0A0F9GHE4_9ZZZZ
MLHLLGGVQEPNLLDPSEDLTNVGQYSLTSLNISNNNAVSPDGLISAELFEPIAVNSFLQANNTSVDINTDYTFSVFLKSTGANRAISISIRTTGLVLIGDNELITVTGNWKRFLLTRNVASNTLIRMLIGGGSTWSTGEDLHAWGCQLNKGPLSSYQRVGAQIGGLNITDFDSLDNWADSEGHTLTP